MADFTGLRDLVAKRVAERPLRTTKAYWGPPQAEHFRFGVTLNFDQTLGRAGWSVLRSADGLKVIDSGVLIPDVGDLKGDDATRERANQLDDLMAPLLECYVPWMDAVCFEASIHQGERTDSSLIASIVLGLAMKRYGHPVVKVSRKTVLAHYVPHFTRKADVTKVVNALIPPERRGEGRWNQDVHDSVLLGMHHLDRRAT